MTDQPNGETDDPEGNKTVKTSQNVDSERESQDEAGGPNMTGAVAPPSGQGEENQGSEDEEEQS